MASTRIATLRIASELPKGDPFRRRLLDVLRRTAAGKIGPFIRFNNRLWVDSFGYEMDPKEGTWDRLRLVNPKTGLPLKTEVEVTWLRPGELRVYENHRRQPTYKYEDVGMYAPPVDPKEVKAILRDMAEAKALAKRVVETAKAEGLDAGAAVGFAGDVLEDVNWSSLSGNVGGMNRITGLDVQDVSREIDYGVYEAAALAWYVGALVGDRSAMAAVESALEGELLEDKKRAIRDALR